MSTKLPAPAGYASYPCLIAVPLSISIPMDSNWTQAPLLSLLDNLNSLLIAFHTLVSSYAQTPPHPQLLEPTATKSDLTSPDLEPFMGNLILS